MKNSVQIVQTLAYLFPDEDSSLHLMSVAGIDSAYIQYETNPYTRWWSIVDAAIKDVKLDALLAAAQERFPDNRILRALVEKQAPVAPIHILGIWPTPEGQPPLDQKGEAEAIYNAGLDYTALRGASATRAGVVREWERLRPEIVEIGSHGKEGSIWLTDGPTSPGWWSRLVRVYRPRIIVLLACESSVQDQFNVADALFAAGVSSVVSVDQSVGDADAVLFAGMLYQHLAAGETLAYAVDRARLVMSDVGAEMVRLRERAMDGDHFRRPTPGPRVPSAPG